MAVATISDVSVAIGRPVAQGAESDQIDYWLGGVELIIAARLGSVSDLDEDALRYVETEVVAEKVRHNGRSESSITVAVDDGTVTRRYDQPVSASDIPDELWNLLDRDATAASASIRPGFEPDLVGWSVRAPGCWGDWREGGYW